MDYILFHSQFSPSSRKLVEQFPSIIEKSVSVDSSAMRTYAKRLHIFCVPTLVIVMDNKIIERISGYENVYNWLIVTIYRVSKLQPSDELDSQDYSESMDLPPPKKSVVSREVVEDDEENYEEEATTSLDNLLLEDVEEERSTPHVQMGMGVNTMQLAEAMKKERDNLDPGNKKKLALK
jgi:hypothetical protein